MTASRILDAVRVGPFELIPIARIAYGAHQAAGYLVAFGHSEPVAVVVRSAHVADRAFDPAGNVVSIAQLSDEVPGLRARLEQNRPAPGP